ncbi:MAG: ATP-dependent helicase HrpB [Verrucomicrobiota bacterium]
MESSPSVLPILAVADQIVDGLSVYGKVVLSAPTGSGKSTKVPQILIDQANIEGQVIILQPRRLAARLLAKRIASERGSQIGEEVGYQIRFENRVGPRTRIRFVTEAILLRQILEDPALPGVGAIIFDEFHERHVTSDLSLSCALQTVGRERPDLKLVVMSATLDIEMLEDYLRPCARVEASGRRFPVVQSYMGAGLGRAAAPVWERAASAFKTVFREGNPGDILIFMPGVFEIRKTIDAIQSLPEAREYDVLPLHGDLPPDAQDKAVSSHGNPKIIVSTNVAETSITIEGVSVVIDSGLARIARYDAQRGINSLLVEPISRAAAEQRSGRAGRTGPGKCLRLWSEAEHAARPERDTAEVKRIDISDTLLLMKASGIVETDNFPWFEAPEKSGLDRANLFLRDLGAVDGQGRITDDGQRMSRFPLHPRFARLLLEGADRGVLQSVALIAAFTQGRHFYRSARERKIREVQIREIEDHAENGSDCFILLKAFERASAARYHPAACAALGIHGVAARQAAEVAKQLLQLAEQQGLRRRKILPDDEGEAICKCLLMAFSDHLCKRNDRGTRRCRMVHERSGELRRESVVDSEYFIATEIEEREVRGEVTVLLGMATEVRLGWLKELFPEDFVDRIETIYDGEQRRVFARSETRFRDLQLEAKDSTEVDLNRAAELMAAEVVEGNLKLKLWNAEVEAWIGRVNFVARHCPETEIARIDEDGRKLLIEQICEGASSYKMIKDRPVMPIVKEWIRPEQIYYLDTYAPEGIELPRRKRPAKVRYESDGRAFIASKLQDFYDVPASSLRVADGRVPLMVELLAPNGRPAHLTDDLDGFWEGAYAHVRNELAGRYPKHEWREFKP